MNNVKANRIGRRVLAAVLTIVMVLGMIPGSVATALAATTEHPDAVTVTITDKNGDVLKGASVAYTIDSTINGAEYKKGTKTTDDKGTVEVLSASDYVSDDMKITLNVSKTGYQSESVSEEKITSEDQDIKVSLQSTTITGITVTPASIKYDEEKHDALTVSGTEDGDTVWYKLADEEWSRNVPQIQDAGTYQLSVKVERSGYDDYTKNVTAEVKKGTFSVTVEPYEAVYDAESHDSVTVKDTEDDDQVTYKLGDDDFTEKVPQVEDAGTYKVTVKVHRNDNYEDFEVTKTVRVTTEEIEGLSATLYAGTYDQEEHEAVTEVKGIKKGDTVEYKTGNEEWTENVPEVRNAGTYKISIRVKRTNYKTTEIIDLTPANVVVSKADQTIKFGKDNKKSVTFSEDKAENIYDFSAEGTSTNDPEITYTLEKADTTDEADISDIAEIDKAGKLTVKEGGHEIIIKAAVAGDDNYNEASEEFNLVIVSDNPSEMLAFEKDTIHYTLGTDEDMASNQSAHKENTADKGVISYTAVVDSDEKVTLDDVGLTLSEEGELKVADYEKVSEALNQNQDGKLSVKITAAKGEGKNKKGNTVYAACTAAYIVDIQYGATPSDAYMLQNPDGDVLTGPNGTNNWYNTNVTVVPKDGYTIAKDRPETFTSSVVFDDQGVSADRTVYLRDSATGAITAPIRLTEIEKIDAVEPDAGQIRIEFSEPLIKKTLSKVLWFYNPDVTITLTGTDVTSGIDHFSWTYTGSDDASDSILKNCSDDVKAQTAGKDGEYTAQFTLPQKTAEQLKGAITVTATDKAGLTSAEKTDDGRVLVVDTVSPTCSVTYEMVREDGKQQIVNGQHFYSGDVKAIFDITEANFFAEDVHIMVSKDGAKAKEQEVTWKATEVQDQQEAVIVLSGDGDYVVSMVYGTDDKDDSGNSVKYTEKYQDQSDKKTGSYTSEKITIDTIDPMIAFSYSNGNNTSADTDNAQTATIKVTEHNFRASDIVVATVAEDITGKDVSVKDFQAYLQDEDNWTTDEENSDIHIATISKQFADAIYSMTFDYKDLALRNAKEVTTGKFIVDHTKPAAGDMSVTYSASLKDTVLSGVTFGFYNPDVTITFTARDMTSGVDYFIWTYTKEEGASDINVDQYAKAKLKAAQDASDPSKYTASITLPKKVADQLRGSIAFTATDNYANTSNKLTDTGEVIVVDTISPKMTAEYTYTGKTKTKFYSSKDVTATFTVTEANFYAKDVLVEVSKDGGEFKEVTPKWKNVSEDVHIGTCTLKAASNHKADGDYVFRVSYTDRSKNAMTTYTSKPVVIDTTKPVISLSYANKTVKNTLTDSDGHQRKYYDAVQTATITIDEHNFKAKEVEFTIVAKDAAGNTLNASDLFSKSKWTSDGDKHTIKITYPGDANYTFDVAYTDLATNKAKNYKADYFTVDKTAPTGLKISYSKSILDTVLSGISFGFYNAKVTVTVTATDPTTGIHSFNYSYLKASGVSGVNAERVNQTIEEASITRSGATGTAKFEIPGSALGSGNQFNGTVKFTANDRSENKSSEFADSKRIVVDNIAPTASVTYNDPVQTVDGIAYYDGAVNARVTISEANFYSDDVRVTVTKDGASYSVSPSWSGGTGVHTGTFALTEDGDYQVTIAYTDKSLGQMTTYTSGQMTVDTQINAPVVTINGEDGNGKAFKDDVVPAVSFKDTNFDSYEIKLTRTRYNRKNEDVTEQYIGTNVRTWAQGGSGSFDTFTKDEDTDGIYRLTVSMTDKAGHTAETVTEFSVNRYGSIYVYSDYLNSLIADGGIYVQSLSDDLIITEYNADQLVEGSLDVEVSRDGKPLDDVAYTVSPEMNQKTKTGSSGWYQYQYTLDQSNFTADGVYKIAISSKDATGNAPDTTSYDGQTMTFRVDSSAPEISSITGLEESIINATNVTVKFGVFDALSLDSVKVIVNGETVDTITDFSEDMNNYEGTFDIDENSNVQTVQIIAEDKAGNVTDTSTEAFKEACAYTFNDEVMVSTNPFVWAIAWIKAHIGLVAGSLAGIAAVIFFIILLSKRRKKRGEQIKHRR